DLEREGGGPVQILDAGEHRAARDVAKAPAVDVAFERALPPGTAGVGGDLRIVDELERRRQRRAVRQYLPVEQEVLVAPLEETIEVRDPVVQGRRARVRDQPRPRDRGLPVVG